MNPEPAQEFGVEGEAGHVLAEFYVVEQFEAGRPLDGEVSVANELDIEFRLNLPILEPAFGVPDDFGRKLGTETVDQPLFRPPRVAALILPLADVDALDEAQPCAKIRTALAIERLRIDMP